jgi:hypothetical protein
MKAKRAGGVVEVAMSVCGKPKAINSNPTTTKKKKSTVNAFVVSTPLKVFLLNVLRCWGGLTP